MSPRTRNGAWLASISATLFLALLPYSGYIASLPLIQAEWDMSNAQSGLVFSAYLIGSAISSLVLVPLADRISPAKMMASGALISCAANLLFPFVAQGLWTASVTRFVAGAAQVLAYVLGIQIVSKRFASKQRGAAVGLFVGAGYAGTTVSYAFVGLLLGSSSSWQSAYLTAAVASAAGVILSLLLVQTLAKRIAGEAPVESPVPSPPVNGRQKGRFQLSVLRIRPVRMVIMAYALHAAELYLARLWFPLLLGASLVAEGSTAAETAGPAATLAGFMFMTGIAGVFAGGIISDRIGRSRGAAIICATSGACSLVVGWLVGAPPVFLIALGFIYGLMTAADSAIYSTTAIELSPPDLIGSVQAAQSFIGFGVGALVPVLAGVILDVTSGPYKWGVAFSFNGSLALIAVLILLRLPSAMRQ
jgi:MFS family permease